MDRPGQDESRRAYTVLSGPLGGRGVSRLSEENETVHGRRMHCAVEAWRIERAAFGQAARFFIAAATGLTRRALYIYLANHRS
jgi:hypothetical protein